MTTIIKDYGKNVLKGIAMVGTIAFYALMVKVIFTLLNNFGIFHNL